MSSRTCKRGALLGIALLCGCVMANAAPAKTVRDPKPVTRVVHYSDLNLANPAAAKQLYQRIRKAADIVCNRVSQLDTLRYPAYAECRDRAVSDAVEKINLPMLNALHREKASRTTTG